MFYKKPSFIFAATVFLLFIIFAGSLAGDSDMPEASILHESAKELNDAVLEDDFVDSRVDYQEVEKKMESLRRQLSQPNVLKDDIVRGWYLGSEKQKKYGTPNTWVFYEDAENSKWVSPNSLEEMLLLRNQLACEEAGGEYILSCLDTTNLECEYESESFCDCPYGFDWVEDWGCMRKTK